MSRAALYGRKKPIDNCSSMGFSYSYFLSGFLNDLLQTSRLIVNPRLHTSYIVRLYGTVTNVTAFVVFHSFQTFLKIHIFRAVVGMPVE